MTGERQTAKRAHKDRDAREASSLSGNLAAITWFG
jgi:hypothetical protein